MEIFRYSVHPVESNDILSGVLVPALGRDFSYVRTRFRGGPVGLKSSWGIGNRSHLDRRGSALRPSNVRGDAGVRFGIIVFVAYFGRKMHVSVVEQNLIRNRCR